MKKLYRYKYFLVLIFTFAICATNIIAQEPPVRPAIETHRNVQRINAKDTKGLPPEIEGYYTKITISATPDFPDPILKHRLTYYPSEKQPGNAAFLYTEAFSEYTRIYNESLDELYRTSEYRELDLKTDSKKAETLKFKAFPLYTAFQEEFHVPVSADEEEQIFSKTKWGVYDILEKASRRSYHDWSDTYPFKGIATIMENLDKARTLGRYLAGKADWEIRNGKFDDAIRTLRVGLTLAKNTRDNNPQCGLIGFYSGNAIFSMMYEQLDHLSAQPGAPNLYPALTQVCDAGDTLINAMNMEKYYLFPQTVPWDVYDTIDEASESECQSVFKALVDSFLDMNSTFREPYRESGNSLLNTYFSISLYPRARERLIGKGVTPEKIENMSTAQIVTPYLLEGLKQDYDDIMVISALPRGESYTAITYDDSRYPSGTYRDALDMFRILFLPSSAAPKDNYLFTRQRQDLVMITNALRCYAAKHNGTLPDSLDDIKEVPVPKIDLMTGKPYQYRRTGKIAIIDYTTYGLSRFEITLE